MENRWIALEKQYGAQNYAPLPVVLTRGEGVWVWDTTGRRYLDCMGAYSAISLGHGHPRLVATLCRQAARLAVTSRAFYTDQLGPFLERACQVSGMEMALPMNSGAEAVETAIKAARRWGYRKKGIAADQAQIIVANGNFHGRTTTIVSFSSEAQYRADFGPLTPGFISVPYGDVGALERAITPNCCALLLEPIQGEAGIIVPPEGYLRAAADLCRKHNLLFLLDEIQTGLGRTGRWFAFQHEGIVPDGLMLGKALGGGLLPVSLFLSRRDVMELFEPGSHGSTFGGNPLAAAIGLETLKVLAEEKLVERSQLLGARLLHIFQSWRYPLIRAVRGQGLMIGLDIDPAVASARAIAEQLMSVGLLTKETHQTVLRIAPPLVIEQEQIDFLIEKIDQTCKIYS
jgi:ornithine--oxo-acid transaminase